MDPNPSASADVTTGSLDGTGQVGTYFYTAPEIAQGWPHIDEKVCPQALRSHLLCCMKFQMLSESLLPYADLFFCSVVVIPLSSCCSLVGHHIYDRPCSCFLVTSNELPKICFISLGEEQHEVSELELLLWMTLLTPQIPIPLLSPRYFFVHGLNVTAIWHSHLSYFSWLAFKRWTCTA